MPDFSHSVIVLYPDCLSGEGPLQKPFAEPLSDEVRHQPELCQLDLIRLTTVRLSKACGRSSDVPHLHFVQRVVEHQGEFASAQPVISVAHGTGKITIVPHEGMKGWQEMRQMGQNRANCGEKTIQGNRLTCEGKPGSLEPYG